MGARSAAAHAEWDKLLAEYRQAHSGLGQQVDAIQAGGCPRTGSAKGIAARDAGRTGKILGMHSFGMSTPDAAVAQHFGFTPDRVVETAKQAMAAG